MACHLIARGAARAVLCVFLLALAPALVRAEPLTLTIVHVNDWDRMDDDRGMGGAAKIASVVKDERARAEADGGLAIVTFGGDMISPSLLSGIDKGAHMIDLANAVGIDVAVLGNHEFDFGPEILIKRLAESKTRWLAGNVAYKGKSGFPGTAATWMTEKAGYKIGFLGLVTPEAMQISSAGEDVVIGPPEDAGAILAAELKKAGADIVIAITHDGLAADLELLRAVKDIDVLLGGHDHLLTAWYDGRQAVMKAGSQGGFVGVLDLAIDRTEGRRGPALAWTPSYTLASTAAVEPDPEVAAKVAAYKGRLDKELGQIIGTSTTELDTRRSSVRAVETAFGNLVTDAMRIATKSDAAITNGGGIRGDKQYPAGVRLARKDVLTELPFGNKTVKLSMTGAQLLQALEIGVSQVESSKGRFAQVSGLSFVYDAGKPVGARVKSVKIGDAPLDAAKTYTVATNDFMARGGDGYDVFRAAKVLIDANSATLMATQVINHIAAAGTIAPKIEGRITREN
jgi:2',3'-cyclic-nucleotide 2'-phosphodiesterase (5'-nucleotidase family)